jgi:hypothetical protein
MESEVSRKNPGGNTGVFSTDGRRLEQSSAVCINSTTGPLTKATRFGVLRAILAAAILLCALVSQGHAAYIKIIPEYSNAKVAFIGVFGDISTGDTNELLGLPTDGRLTLVVLSSNGGDATEGLQMAKLVRKLGWSTAVIGDEKCFSACALIWISGKERWLSHKATVGFHAVYTSSGVSSAGNAIYGAFYSQLGLSDRAIEYLTSAPPSGYNQLTLESAPLLDIEVTDFDKLISESTNSNVSVAQTTPGTVPSNVSTAPPNTEEISSNNDVKPNETNNTPVTRPMFELAAGFDIIGFDLPNGSFKTTSQDFCQLSCQAKLDCGAYTYDIRNHVCYMKSGGRVKLASTTAFSGARTSVYDSLRFSQIVIFGKQESAGFDYKAIDADKLESCVFACDQDTACVAFSYFKKLHICSLKNGHDRFSTNKLAVSGLKGIQ